MKHQAVCLFVLVLFTVSWGIHVPYQQFPAGGRVQQDNGDNFIGNAREEQDGGEFPELNRYKVYQQQDGADGGFDEEMEEQQDGSDDGTMDDEGEKQPAEVMFMNMDDFTVDEQIAGEFFEGPSESFMEMEQTPPDEEMGGQESPSEQRHLLGKRGTQTEEGEGGKENGGDEIVMAQWNNQLHKPFSVVCPAGFGLSRIRSVFYSSAKDRLFLLTCKRVAPLCGPRRNYNPAARRCQWHRMNSIKATGSFHCPANYYLTGARTAVAGCKRDREWHGLCCHTPQVCMVNCRWTGYLNSYCKNFDYSTAGVFGGMISHFNMNYWDRMYRVTTCSIKTC